MNVKIENLDEEIKKQLEEYNLNVVQATNESIQETAKEAVKTLKQGGPYQKRTGKYAKSWAIKQKDRSKSVIKVGGYTVYNKEHHQLTHLLEFGHQSKKGGRAKAFSHIAPVNEQVGNTIAEKIEQKLRG